MPVRMTRALDRARLLMLAGGCCMQASAAWAQPPLLHPAQPLSQLQASIHVDRYQHGDTDRVVLWLRRGSLFAARLDGDDLVIDLPENSALAGTALANGPGSWLRRIACAPGQARLVLLPGARPRVRQYSDRVLIDVDAAMPPLLPGQTRPTAPTDGVWTPRQVQRRPAIVTAMLAPPPARSSAPVPGGAAIGQAATPPATTGHVAGPPSAGPAAAATPPHAAASPISAPVPALVPAVDPGALADLPAPVPAGTAISVRLLTGEAASAGPSILLPMDRAAAAAAYLRGGELHLVFDVARLLDLSQLKDDPVFGGASERLLSDGTELRMRLPPGLKPRLERHDVGWVLFLATAAPAATTTSLVGAGVRDGTLMLQAPQPGHVVPVEDEATGSRLLVGTVRVAGQHVAAPHRAAEWTLLPSLQGVVVQPAADRVALRDKEAGFVLEAADPPALGIVWSDRPSALDADGRVMTRRFDFPGLGAPALRRRLDEALRDAALAPHAGRTAPRVRVAEAMLAGGLDSEAEAVLKVAAADDPACGQDPRVEGLHAIAAWLSAKAGGSTAVTPPGFDPVTLGDSDEAALWRAVWAGGQADATGPAATLARSWRLVLDYPDGLRRLLLPAMAETLARGGQDGALAALLAAFPDRSLDLARAGLQQRQGRVEASLHTLDMLAAGDDRLVRAQARAQAVELRLALHRLTPAQAADQLDSQFYAWRGGMRELGLRLRSAELRAQAGAWRPALALLQDTDALFPDAHERIHAAEIAAVSGVLQADRASRLDALDLVALADQAAALLGPADTDAALAPLLADRLLGLDLPTRAEPILRKLLDHAAVGPAKAGLGLRLAAMDVDQGEDQKALAVLAATADAAVPAGEDRLLLEAGALARLGRSQEAGAALAGLASRPAVELRAKLDEQAQAWPDAERTLLAFIETDGFDRLDQGIRQEVVLRAARDAAQADDTAGLRRLRTEHAGLFPAGQGGRAGALFAVLTADPVQRLTDLPRSGQELGAMRALPASLASR